MIAKPILDSIRAGTCAIGHFKKDPTAVIRDRAMKGLSVLGTGFLVRPGLVITAAHVVDGLSKQLRKKRLPEGWKFLQFVYPGPSDRQWHQVLQKIAGEGEVTPVRRHAKSADGQIARPKLDVGFLDFEPTDDDAYRICLPLTIGRADSILVGQQVAVCGYPHGERMLLLGEDVYRFGPAIQQGYISAVAPMDAPGVGIRRILLDVRTAPGMSGAPVFLLETGEVIGLLTSGWEDRDSSTSFATPLSTETMPKMLGAVDTARASDT